MPASWRRFRTLLPLALCAACQPEPEGGRSIDACADVHPLFADTSFVIVTAPRPGDAVPTGFEVRGCSRTFESNVVWELTGRDGRTLASGYTSGGGVEGAGSFSFEVAYSPGIAEIGLLTVAEPRVADGEGFPPVRVVMPLALIGVEPAGPRP